MNPTLLKASGGREEVIRNLQKQAQNQLFERVLCDVNDALTSILAVCDIDAKKAVPKVKGYIQRINGLLQTAKEYQASQIGEASFNLNLVLANILDVVEHFSNKEKGSLKFNRSLSEIKSMVHGKRSALEEMLLRLLVDLVRSKAVEAKVDLQQKGHEAVVKITVVGAGFSADSMEKLETLKKECPETSSIYLANDKDRADAVIRLPMQFNPQKTIVPVSSVSIKKVTETKSGKKEPFISLEGRAEYAF